MKDVDGRTVFPVADFTDKQSLIDFIINNSDIESIRAIPIYDEENCETVHRIAMWKIKIEGYMQY